MSNMCPAPWVSRVFRSNGSITPCCYTQEQNIDQLKNLFLSGTRPPQCQYCWYHEDNNMHSPRQDFINFSNEQLSDSVKMISLNLGNYCNAECIICNGQTSSKRNTWARKNSKNEFFASTISISNLEIDFEQYPDLMMVTLIGGEPMLHPNTKSVLIKMIELGLAKNVTISFNTNASIFDQEIVSLLKQFKSILITLSIDGAGKYFEYQRRPLEWNTVSRISLQWMEISESIIINYVVSAISIWGFSEFVSWYDQLPKNILEKDPHIIFVHVNSKPHLTLSVLTEEQRLQWISDTADHRFKQYIVDIFSTVKFNNRLLELLAKHVALEDQTAKVKFSDIFPDWKLNA
jgi:sulfatase maturation enzyme AslB (radical SAM superfamily)